MTGDLYVTVRGVVYRWSSTYVARRRRLVECWRRASIPPDVSPGSTRTTWPATYRPGRLPAHEVVAKDEAQRLIQDSTERFYAAHREAAAQAAGKAET